MKTPASTSKTPAGFRLGLVLIVSAILSPIALIAVCAYLDGSGPIAAVRYIANGFRHHPPAPAPK
jgi:hypothetical protein